MGVTFQVEGLAYEDSYDCGYAIFDGYRIALAQAINPVAGRVYEVVVMGDADYEEIGGKDVLMLGLDASEMADERFADGEAVKGELRRLCPVGAADGGLAFHRSFGDGSHVSVRITYDAMNEMMREAYGEDLASFLSAPDTEGELTGEECLGILRDLSRFGSISVPVLGHNYGEAQLSVGEDGKRQVTLRHYNMHEQFVGMFRHCADNGVVLTWD